MERVRSFIAVELPDGLKAGLSRLETRLRENGPSGVKWVDPYSIHLTLKFLGSVAADKLDDITQAMAAAVREVSPFRLEAGEVGAFPDLKRVRVVWVGVGGEVDKLLRLQQRLEAGLVKLGFPAENRPFVPHLTLARLRDSVSPQERQRLGQAIAGAGLVPAGDIPVEGIVLMRSQLTRQGAVYSPISSVRLESLL